MIDQDRLVRPGVDFTTRADMKYAHALTALNSLMSMINEWNASYSTTARVHVVDDHHIEFRVVLNIKPPEDQMSLLLADAIHNFRSAFDIVAWELAHLDGATPTERQEKLVTFPVTADERIWDETAKNLPTIPEPFLSRMRALQPWNHDEPSQHLLRVLHDLDILDKHKGLLSGSLHIDEVATDGFEMGLSPVPSDDEPAMISRITKHDPVRAVDDAVVGKWSVEPHTFHPDLEYRARLHHTFRIERPDGRGAFLLPYTTALSAGVREMLDFLYGGDLHMKFKQQARSATGGAVVQSIRNIDGSISTTTQQMMPTEN